MSGTDGTQKICTPDVHYHWSLFQLSQDISNYLFECYHFQRSFFRLTWSSILCAFNQAIPLCAYFLPVALSSTLSPPISPSICLLHICPPTDWLTRSLGYFQWPHSTTRCHAVHVKAELLLPLLYRDRLKSMQILLSMTQEGPGRTGKQEQEQTSRNHIQTF